jgi:hypothetical protein
MLFTNMMLSAAQVDVERWVQGHASRAVGQAEREKVVEGQTREAAERVQMEQVVAKQTTEPETLMCEVPVTAAMPDKLSESLLPRSAGTASPSHPLITSAPQVPRPAAPGPAADVKSSSAATPAPAAVAADVVSPSPSSPLAARAATAAGEGAGAGARGAAGAAGAVLDAPIMTPEDQRIPVLGGLVEATLSASLIMYRLVQDSAWVEKVQKEAPVVLLEALRIGVKVGSKGGTHRNDRELYCSEIVLQIMAAIVRLEALRGGVEVGR